jgi:hypothetical protein
MSDMKTIARRTLRSTPPKLKRVVEDMERNFGWTSAAVTRFMRSEGDPDRLSHVLSILSISENDYKYDFKSTVTADYNLANGYHCVAAGYDVRQTQFVCRTLGKLFDDAIKSVQATSEVNFDQIRAEVIESLRGAVNHFNSGEGNFSPKQTQEFLSFVTQTLIRPIRLLLHPWYGAENTAGVAEPRKMSAPPKPVALGDCRIPSVVIPDDQQFPILPFFQTDTMPLEDLRRCVRQYTQQMIDVINKRYDLIDQQMGSVLPLLNQ